MSEQFVIEVLEWAILKLMSEHDYNVGETYERFTTTIDDVIIFGWKDLIATNTFKNIETIIQRGLDTE